MSSSETEKLFSQRIILVTGAAEGLGKELAFTLAEHGATVILLDHQVPLLEELYDDIVKAGYPEPAIYPMQLAGASTANVNEQGETVNDFNDLSNAIKNTLGRLDGIIHNAAYLKSLTPLPNLNYETWMETLQVNLTAPFLITQSCLPLLKEASSAFILFISDRVSSNYAYRGAYGVSKAALDELANTFRDELEENTNIEVISHDPGAMQTRLRLRMFPGQASGDVPTAKDAVGPILKLLE